MKGHLCHSSHCLGPRVTRWRTCPGRKGLTRRSRRRRRRGRRRGRQRRCGRAWNRIM
jgi:hypothetical protein